MADYIPQQTDPSLLSCIEDIQTSKYTFPTTVSSNEILNSPYFTSFKLRPSFYKRVKRIDQFFTLLLFGVLFSLLGFFMNEDVNIEANISKALTNSPIHIINPISDDIVQTIDIEPIVQKPIIKSEKKIVTKPIVHQSKTKKSKTKTIKKTKEESISSPSITDASLQNDYLQIKKLAQLEGKPYFIQFGAKWCLPCKMMKEHTLSNPDVKDYISANYHQLEVDVESFDGVNLKQQYDVRILPTIVFFDAYGNITDRYEEGLSSSRFLSILEENNPKHYYTNHSTISYTKKSFEEIVQAER